MKKVERLLKIKEARIVAVIRKDSKEEAKKITETLIEAGITTIEITLTTPNALELIKELTENNENQVQSFIGAGTVVEKEMALLAIQAGAEFIVSPVFDKEIAQVCNYYQIPYIPGCMTVNEMKNALMEGIDIIKLFPASQFSPRIIKDIKGPIPQVNIMPSGGINGNNANDWLEAGAVAISVGGELTSSVERCKELSKLYLNQINLEK